MGLPMVCIMVVCVLINNRIGDLETHIHCHLTQVPLLPVLLPVVAVDPRPDLPE